MRREEILFYQNTLSLSDLQIDYLNLYNSVRATEKANLDHSMWIYCGGSQPTEIVLSNKERERATIN